MGEAKVKAAKNRAAAPVSAAVHSDEIWGGPRYVYNASAEPVFVRTKKEYWDLLARSGWRMKHQQESSTGAESKAPIPVPKELLEPDVPPMTQKEAQIYGAVTAVFRRYGLIETVWCDDCFQRHRHHGCRMIVHPREVSMECRCGKAIYVPPAGTTDTVIEKIATSDIVELDKMPGSVMTKIGAVMRPTVVLQDLDAKILLAYVKALQRRNKEPRIFHNACFVGQVMKESNALAISIGSRDTMLVCECRVLFHRRHAAHVAPDDAPILTT